MSGRAQSRPISIKDLSTALEETKKINYETLGQRNKYR